jgi:hypothetical protein
VEDSAVAAAAAALEEAKPSSACQQRPRASFIVVSPASPPLEGTVDGESIPRRRRRQSDHLNLAAHPIRGQRPSTSARLPRKRISGRLDIVLSPSTIGVAHRCYCRHPRARTDETALIPVASPSISHAQQQRRIPDSTWTKRRPSPQLRRVPFERAARPNGNLEQHAAGDLERAAVVPRPLSGGCVDPRITRPFWTARPGRRDQVSLDRRCADGRIVDGERDGSAALVRDDLVARGQADRLPLRETSARDDGRLCFWLTGEIPAGPVVISDFLRVWRLLPTCCSGAIAADRPGWAAHGHPATIGLFQATDRGRTRRPSSQNDRGPCWGGKTLRFFFWPAWAFGRHHHHRRSPRIARGIESAGQLIALATAASVLVKPAHRRRRPRGDQTRCSDHCNLVAVNLPSSARNSHRARPQLVRSSSAAIIRTCCSRLIAPPYAAGSARP